MVWLVSCLQRTCQGNKPRIGIILVNLRAGDRSELGLVENEDVDEREQVTIEIDGWRRIEDRSGANGLGAGKERLDGRNGDFELAYQDIAFRQRRLHDIAIRQQGIGAGDDHYGVVAIGHGDHGRAGVSVRGVLEKLQITRFAPQENFSGRGRRSRPRLCRSKR